LLFQKAEWQIEDGQKEAALAEWDRILEMPIDTVEALKLHSQLLQNAGRFSDAVKDWKRLDQLSERSGRPGRAEALNGLAYAQALANNDLDDALDHINEALDLSPDNPAMLDTRGYLLYLTERYEPALADMNVAVREFEKSMEQILPQAKPAVQTPAEDSKLFRNRSKTLLEVAASQSPARGVAVVRYHRALVLQALGKEKEAQADLARAKQLIGREPDETLF
jgi:tetratricopeptide (TPR) repeat protein